MRIACWVIAALVAGCADPQYAADIRARQVTAADLERAALIRNASVTPEQRMQQCLDIEVRSIVVRPIAANPDRAADIVMSDCQPHADIITRNMSLREAVQYHNTIKRSVLAQIVDATR